MTAVQHRQVVTEQHHTALMDAEGNGLCGGNLVIGVPSKQFSSCNSSFLMQKQN